MAFTAVGHLGRGKAVKVSATIFGLVAPRAIEDARSCPAIGGFRGAVRPAVS